ncbi:MAG: uracil-DNA glycosylase [Oscillospiraceae bacterium]|nr:uracil-DNA glycosylase [Oscillospiraceae bacterium]MBQ6902875.1 uracil-DNA glycosylase [Oscillospiraceae bacterium]
MIDFGNDWNSVLSKEFEKDYYLSLREFLKTEYREHTVYPDMYDIYNALKFTSYSDVKVVILGQDPYHGEGQAHGLAFSVKDGVPLPPSLRNMYKEIYEETGNVQPESGNLTRWAKQGVLLLNTALTVRSGQANSHSGKGWEIFTDCIIEKLNAREKTIVFLLWGRNARSKERLITNPNHKVFSAAHPSPLSAYNGFFGCGHFNAANRELILAGEMPIIW